MVQVVPQEVMEETDQVEQETTSEVRVAPEVPEVPEVLAMLED
jgi:hypothetical protein